ncbi:hypothetical protein EDC44_12920, partial [Cricetibacter osteomyelitidis]
MSTTLKVLSAKKVIASHQIEKGNQLTIEARDKSNYQLIDDQTGLGPQNIIVKREGNDLKIFLEDGDMSADVIIKNYYDQTENTSNLLVGEHENGNIYAYVPESGMKTDAVSMLAEQVAAPQALGGEEIGAFWAFNPWWLLALAPIAAGIAIAASNGGSDSGNGNNGGNNNNTDTTADKPTITLETNGNVTVKPGDDNTKVVITYTDEDSNDKTATVEKDANGSWKSDDSNVEVNQDGTFTIPANKVKDNSEVNAKGTDDKNNTTDADSKIAGDTKKPGDSNGDGVVNGNDNSTDKAELPRGLELPRNTAGAPNIVFGEDQDADGKLNAGESVSIDGNRAITPVYITIPDKTEVGDNLVLTINGTEKVIPVTKEMITAGYIIEQVSTDKDSDVTVTAKVTDPAGNESKMATAVLAVDTIAPTIEPTVTANLADGSVSIDLPADLEVGDKVEVSYTPEGTTEPKKVTLTKQSDGTFKSDDPNVEVNETKATIPANKVADGQPVVAKAVDAAGNAG